MKINNYILFCSLFMLLACNDYLDESPNSQYDISLDTEESIAELLTGAYPTASYYPFLEPRTDNADKRTSGKFYRLNDAMFFWRDFEEEDIDTPLNYWISAYKGISQANHALELLRKFPKNKRVNALYAEAFLIRSYLHFMLVNIWSKHYNPATAATDLGIPYVNSPEKNAFVNYSRGSVQQTYENIEKDLQYGLSVISDDYFKKPAYHFNKTAAYAFASRFYLYKGDWDKVIAYSNWVLSSGYYEKMRDWKKYRKIALSNDNYSKLGKVYFSEEEKTNLLLVTTESRTYRRYIPEENGLTSKVTDELYKKGFTKLDENTTWGYGYSSSNQNTTYVDKFDEYSKNITGNVVNPTGIYVNNALFTIEEVLLNRAEAHIMKGDYYKGITDIQQFIKKRKFYNLYSYDELKKAFPKAITTYHPYYSFEGIYQASLIKLITELRRKEFVHEGLRWFDIRRFDLVVDRNRGGEPYSENKVLIRKDNRKVLQIPSEAIRYGLEPN